MRIRERRNALSGRIAVFVLLYLLCVFPHCGYTVIVFLPSHWLLGSLEPNIESSSDREPQDES